MSFNWINPANYSINSLLLMDRWMLKQLIGLGDSPSFEQNLEYRKAFAIVLKYNAVISWFVSKKCPEASSRVDKLIEEAPTALTHDEISSAETFFINEIDTMIVYLYPDDMNNLCPYIRDWDKEKLLSLVDFSDKVVLYIGSGTGRLAFAAKKVYASEPSDQMREYMRDKILSDKISNMQRVCKNGGYIVVCEGENETKWHRREPLLSLGFEYLHYLSKVGGDCYRYWKKANK